MAEKNFTPVPGFNPMPREDVAAFFECCSDAFGQIAAVADALIKNLPNHSNDKKLAELIKYVGQDYENMANSWEEQAKKGGVRQ